MVKVVLFNNVFQQGMAAAACSTTSLSLPLFTSLPSFGIACHRVLFHWLSEDQIVRRLTIPEQGRSDPVLDDAPARPAWGCRYQRSRLRG